MPLKNYGVLKGAVVDTRFASGKNPHYQVKVVDDRDVWRIAINVQSADQSLVEYIVDSQFQHPILERLQGCSRGFTPLPSSEKHGLDFIRGNLVNFDEFVPLPMNLPGPDNDLNEKLHYYINRAKLDQDAEIYAFGETWGPEGQRDKVFEFSPGRGIHDIHMNQGNEGPWKKDNGVWQDGGLILRFPATSQWVAIFLKFQTQPRHTDDVTGNSLSGTSPVVPPGVTPPRPVVPGETDGHVRIVAALVNDDAPVEQESVTLLNVTPNAIDLTGWTLRDQEKRSLPLSGTINKGETKTVLVRPQLELSNRGGIISLINAQGLRVDGVQYTKEQVRKQGWTIKF
ncbi:MAG: DUF2278 family protein [Nitrospirae bacterium]|nr:DUF2278 family protein [Magnetococcales bacterium]HAT50078.1 DUF2278 domain-containing protein [Alphaproteobacteria bacterium]